MEKLYCLKFNRNFKIKNKIKLFIVLKTQVEIKRRKHGLEKPWNAPQKYQICESVYVHQVICPKSHNKYVVEGSFDPRWHKLAIIESTLCGGHYVYSF